MTQRAPCTYKHCLAIGMMASALVAGCDTSSSHPYPPEFDRPYGVIAVGEESAMRASTSCSFSFTAPPTVMPGNQAEAACPCTRRAPYQDAAAQCLAGADRGVTATIGPEGGNLLLRNSPSPNGEGVLLEIPPNALAEPTAVRIIETSIAPPAGFVDLSPVYVFEPVGLALAVPAFLHLPYDSNGERRFDYAIHWSGEADVCSLEPLADDYNNAGVHQGSVSRLGWAVVGRVRAASEPACP